MKTIITLSLSLLFAMPTMANETTKGFNYAKHNKAKKRRQFLNRTFNLNNCKHYKQHK
jgi:hypothetical protein